MTKSFKEYLFNGLNVREVSNKYLTMDRVSSDKNKIVVKVASNNIIKTKFGWALIIDNTRVVFLKDWQVNVNWYGTEVLLNREYFNVKTWGEHSEFGEDDTYCSFDNWVKVAEDQEAFVDADGMKVNPVRWEK